MAQRSMNSAGGAQMLYNVYADSSHTTIFGDGTGGSISPTRTVSKTSPWNLILFAEIPALQNVTPGIYTDALVATILW